MLSVEKFYANRVYRYNVELIYLTKKKNIKIKNECIKSIIIDHNISQNCMPIVYMNLWIDKKMADKIIKECNKNLFAFRLKKFNTLVENPIPIECFNKKFTYVLPTDVTKSYDLDYNEERENNTKTDTNRDLSIGLICIDHININKQNVEINASNGSIMDFAKYAVKDCKNLILEPFANNKKYKQFTMKPQNSVNEALKTLNDQRVFYETPYRFYMDFNNSFLISSSGKYIKKPDDVCKSVIIKIKDAITDESDEGFELKDEKANIPVKYVDTKMYDNTAANKHSTTLRGASPNSKKKQELVNTAEYSKKKTDMYRINNNNTLYQQNLQVEMDNNNFFIFFSKSGLDMDLFTPNKKITVKNIDRYKEFNGVYLVYRVRHNLIREHNSFVLASYVNMQKIGYKD